MTVYDEDEPRELQGLTIGPTEFTELGGVPLSADGCVFAGCDLSVTHFGIVKNCRFENSKLLGTVFAKRVADSTFVNCQLTECRLRMMSMDGVTFDECQLNECDFYGSNLVRVAFPKSHFVGVGFDACTIDAVDLSAAASLEVGDPRTLKGATIDPAQVHAIADRLAVLSGIHVQPTNENAAE